MRADTTALDRGLLDMRCAIDTVRQLEKGFQEALDRLPEAEARRAREAELLELYLETRAQHLLPPEASQNVRALWPVVWPFVRLVVLSNDPAAHVDFLSSPMGHRLAEAIHDYSDLGPEDPRCDEAIEAWAAAVRAEFPEEFLRLVESALGGDW